MIAVVDYGMGNVGSVLHALQSLGAEAKLTQNAADFAAATHIILPGVGAFGDGMKNLRDRGLIEILENEVRKNHKSFLGICLGMQLLAERGEEGGDHIGLGFVQGTVRRFRVDESKFRIPHVGWNDVTVVPNARLFSGIDTPVFYFVHSYVLDGADPSQVVGTCDYGEVVPVAVENSNIYGTQFHPEKSQKAGLALLKNFIAL